MQKTQQIQEIIERLKQYLPALDEQRVLSAYAFAEDAHRGQKRYSGEPYIIHPLNVASLLVDFHPDEDSIVAALLHDVSEDTDRTIEEIEREFGPVVGRLVFGLEKLSKVRSRLNETQVENLRKLFLVMAKDFRVAMIKLCDRLHNISTLQYVPENKQKRIAQETLDIYAPIAARLGIYRLKTQLEDHAFSFLEPEQYKEIFEQLSVSGKERDDYINETKNMLDQLLACNGVQGMVEGRRKGIYSIYRKMKRKGKSQVLDIFDIFAMRMVLPNIFKYDQEFHGHLYSTLGLIHGKFTPLAHRFKDYVAVPKVNGYRSLHTTVMGLGPKSYTQPTEIQLRTQLMHEQAEYGVAAHWIYESFVGRSEHTLEERVKDGSVPREIALTGDILKRQMSWMQGLSKLQAEVTSDDELMKDLKLDIFQDRIFVLTPRGDVKDLPAGATPVDFAYAVHTDIGNRCTQAKVNGNIVPLRYKFHNGDVVEIITSKNAQPSQNWLSFVKTNHAKSRVRSWLRNLDRDKNMRVGRELFNQHLERIGKPPLDPDLSVFKCIDGKRKTLKDREDLLVEMGKGTLVASTLLKKLFSLEEILSGTRENTAPKKQRLTMHAVDNREHQVLVGGRKDMPVHFGSCCAPDEKSAIVGFVTRGKGITIHTTACTTLSRADKKRFVDAYWISSKTGMYRVNIRLEVEDRVGLIRDISTVFANASLNIIDFIYHKTANNGDGAVRDICVEVKDFDQLEAVLIDLEAMPEVKRARLK